MTPSLPAYAILRFERTIMNKSVLIGIVAGAMSMLPALCQTAGDSGPAANSTTTAAANTGAAVSGVYPAGPGGRNTPLPRPPLPDPAARVL